MQASLLAAMYGVWLAATWRAKERPGPWGYEWVAICVQRIWFDAVAYLSGVTGSLHFHHFAGSSLSDGEASGLQRQAIPCVVTVSPHGAFGIGFFILHFHRLFTDPRFKMFDCFAGGASVLFKLPLLRELLLLLRVREANRRTLDGLLRAGKTVALNPGGIHEQVHTSHTEESIHLQPKLGFIRLAMRHGVPLLPGYGFGENQLYRSAPFAALTLPLRRWVAERLRVGLPAVHGRFGSPFPYPTHHSFVIGNPVHTGPPNPNPTDEEVAEVLGRWKAEMRRIFDAHRHLLPPEAARRGLTISARQPGSRL